MAAVARPPLFQAYRRLIFRVIFASYEGKRCCSNPLAFNAGRLHGPVLSMLFRESQSVWM